MPSYITPGQRAERVSSSLLFIILSQPQCLSWDHWAFGRRARKPVSLFLVSFPVALLPLGMILFLRERTMSGASNQSLPLQSRLSGGVRGALCAGRPGASSVYTCTAPLAMIFSITCEGSDTVPVPRVSSARAEDPSDPHVMCGIRPIATFERATGCDQSAENGARLRVLRGTCSPVGKPVRRMWSSLCS